MRSHFRRCSAHDDYASLPEKWGKRIYSKVQNSNVPTDAAATLALECGSSLKRTFLVYLDYYETYLLIWV